MNSWVMAEDFQTVICGENWWSSLIDGWSSDLGSIKDIALAESDSVSDASIVSHETPKAKNSESSTGNGSIFVNSALQMMGSSFSSSPTSDWNQNSLNNHIGDVESNFDCLLEEEMDDKMINFHERQETTCKDSSIISFKTCVVEVDEELVPGKYGYQSTMFERILEPENRQEEVLFDNDFSINCSFTANYEATQSLSKQKFSDCTYSGYSCHMNGAELNPSMEENKNLYIPIKQNSTNLQLLKKHESIEPELKRHRIEAPSPLPNFKVRKEKMGDRITALQQLVSPFGKTDTASVLHEAVEYIRFLHDQISVFSTPYIKTELLEQDQDQDQQEAAKQDLRRQGLCLVPICSTFPFVNEITPGFWMPKNLNHGEIFR